MTGHSMKQNIDELLKTLDELLDTIDRYQEELNQILETFKPETEQTDG